MTVLKDRDCFLCDSYFFHVLLRVERSFNQTLRQQQDQAYLESLRADQEKERQRCEEKERREGEARQQKERELEEQCRREVCLHMALSKQMLCIVQEQI